jgi:hypothetical protein
MDQSLLQSMIILPIAVTGIVLVVHNSLALTFSLTGVVAGVRYRNTLKSTADSLFIFMSVGVGLSAGIRNADHWRRDDHDILLCIITALEIELWVQRRGQTLHASGSQGS